MKQVVGYLIKKGNEIIGATGDEREAIYIARNFKAISYKVITTVNPLEDPHTEYVISYDGTL